MNCKHPGFCLDCASEGRKKTLQEIEDRLMSRMGELGEAGVPQEMLVRIERIFRDVLFQSALSTPDYSEQIERKKVIALSHPVPSRSKSPPSKKGKKTPQPKSGQTYYAVRKGKKPGVYTNSKEALKQVTGFANGKMKKFKSLQEANEFVEGVSSNSKPSKKKSKPLESKRESKSRSPLPTRSNPPRLARSPRLHSHPLPSDGTTFVHPSRAAQVPADLLAQQNRQETIQTAGPSADLSVKAPEALSEPESRDPRRRKSDTETNPASSLEHQMFFLDRAPQPTEPVADCERVYVHGMRAKTNAGTDISAFGISFGRGDSRNMGMRLEGVFSSERAFIDACGQSIKLKTPSKTLEICSSNKEHIDIVTKRSPLPSSESSVEKVVDQIADSHNIIVTYVSPADAGADFRAAEFLAIRASRS